MKRFLYSLLITFLIIFCIFNIHVESQENAEYTVGVGDVLQIAILQPEKSTNEVTVSPDGSITVPYLGSVNVRGKTIVQIKANIQWSLANGYLKYPVVSVSLLQSRSRKYTISGEVIRPGTYTLEDNTTILKAISTAGGFTKFGSSSKVKVLRPRKDRPGYSSIKVDVESIINGSSQADILIQSGDIIIVSEGLF